MRFNDRTHRAVHSARTDCRLHYNSGTFWTDLKDILHRRYNIAWIYLFRELIIRRGHRYNVNISMLIISCELDSRFHSCCKQFIKPFLFKSGMPGIEHSH